MFFYYYIYVFKDNHGIFVGNAGKSLFTIVPLLLQYFPFAMDMGHLGHHNTYISCIIIMR